MRSCLSHVYRPCTFVSVISFLTSAFQLSNVNLYSPQPSVISKWLDTYFVSMDIRFRLENGVWVAGRCRNDLPLLTIILQNVWTMRTRRGLVLRLGGEPSLFSQLDLFHVSVEKNRGKASYPSRLCRYPLAELFGKQSAWEFKEMEGDAPETKAGHCLPSIRLP